MFGHVSAVSVAGAFVKQYYYILRDSPENLHKFYKDPSLLGWPELDGVLRTVTTLDGIYERVMSSSYKYCSAEVQTADAQQSSDGGIIVAVTGCLVGKDDSKKNFSQTFFLAKQENGFYVLNDILRFIDVCERRTNTVSSSNLENNQHATAQNSVNGNTADSPTSFGTKAVVENGNVKEASMDHSVPKVTLENGVAPTPSLSSCERDVAQESSAKEQSVATPKEQSDVAPAKNAKVPSDVALAKIAKGSSLDNQAKNAEVSSVGAPATNAKVPSVDAPATNAKEPSVDAPASNAKEPSVDASAENQSVPSVFTPVSNVSQKFSYASVLAKEVPVTSPKAAVVITISHNQTVSSPKTQATAPLSNGSPKASNSGGSESKGLAPTSKVATKLPTISQPALNSSCYAEAKVIYIGSLPSDISKQGVVDVLKKFGPIRRYSDNVQLRRHEDGFCCGFVKYEHPDAARRAVEAHHVMFGEKRAYITYKRSTYNRGNGGRARSPTRGGNRIRRQESDEWTYYSKGQGRGPRGSSSSR